MKYWVKILLTANNRGSAADKQRIDQLEREVAELRTSVRSRTPLPEDQSRRKGPEANFGTARPSGISKEKGKGKGAKRTSRSLGAVAVSTRETRKTQVSVTSSGRDGAQTRAANVTTPAQAETKNAFISSTVPRGVRKRTRRRFRRLPGW